MSLLEYSAVAPPAPPAPSPVPLTVIVSDDVTGDTAATPVGSPEAGVVADAADAVLVARVAPPASPEVVVLDLHSMSALDAVQAVLDTIPDARVLVVSARDAPARVADLIAAVRGPGSPAPAADRPRLTGRETEVVRLVASGLTSQQIANRLVLSRRTVENHVQRVMGKLQLHNRVELVRFVIAAGLG